MFIAKECGNTEICEGMLGIFLFITASKTTPVPHPDSYPMYTRGSFLRVKAIRE
jgi:hypothetical protein